MTFVDVHAHYNLYDDTSWIKEAKDANTIIILNGMNSETNRACLKLAQEHTHIKVALGWHPEYVKTEQDRDKAIEEIKWIKSVAKEQEVYAIGEIGLDHFHTDDDAIKELQEEVFLRYLKIAETLTLPVILHTRNAQKRILPLLGEKQFSQPVILHCFEASDQQIKEAIKEGYYFTIPAAVVRNDAFKRVLDMAPLGRVLTEADAPYQGPTKGVDAKPTDIASTVSYIAKEKKLDVKEMEHMIYQNYMKVFL